MQTNSQNVCQTHSEEFVAMCITCKKYLCIDCIIEHQQNHRDHSYKKIKQLVREQTAEVDQALARLENMKSEIPEIKPRGSQLRNLGPYLRECQNTLDLLQAEMEKQVRIYVGKLKTELEALVNQTPGESDIGGQSVL